jgi:hypothetical protein
VVVPMSQLLLECDHPTINRPKLTRYQQYHLRPIDTPYSWPSRRGSCSTRHHWPNSLHERYPFSQPHLSFQSQEHHHGREIEAYPLALRHIRTPSLPVHFVLVRLLQSVLFH